MVYTDEWRGTAGCPQIGRGHATVCHGAGEWARDDDGDGVREVHCNTLEGLWTGLRNFLRPFRGVNKSYLHQYAGIFQWGYIIKRVTGEFIRSLLGRRSSHQLPDMSRSYLRVIELEDTGRHASAAASRCQRAVHESGPPSGVGSDGGHPAGPPRPMPRSEGCKSSAGLEDFEGTTAYLVMRRSRVETVGSQLAVRYHMKQTRAQDMWHLVHRITRKVLSHTVMICLDVQRTNAQLSFDRLRPAA